uniref:Uncharacterized protein n=1 Tax=Anguilla anguilla TaxID=7936 RepID=A0A0E9XP84_ANGAN
MSKLISILRIFKKLLLSWSPNCHHPIQCPIGNWALSVN